MMQIMISIFSYINRRCDQVDQVDLSFQLRLAEEITKMFIPKRNLISVCKIADCFSDNLRINLSRLSTFVLKRSFNQLVLIQ